MLDTPFDSNRYPDSSRPIGYNVESSPETITLRFNDAINDRDIDRLTSLMTDDHTFIDSAGVSFQGKDAAIEIWKTFFSAFPDYRNEFEFVSADDETVTVVGRSECANFEELDGPALWTAMIRDGRVARWRVYEDTAENRDRLGVAS